VTGTFVVKTQNEFPFSFLIKVIKLIKTMLAKQHVKVNQICRYLPCSLFQHSITKRSIVSPNYRSNISFISYCYSRIRFIVVIFSSKWNPRSIRCVLLWFYTSNFMLCSFLTCFSLLFFILRVRYKWKIKHQQYTADVFSWQCKKKFLLIKI